MIKKTFTHVDTKENYRLEKIISKTLSDDHPLKDICGRIYQCPGDVVYPSVTSILGIRGKEHIDKWKRKVGEEQAKKIAGAAADRGTFLHETVENFLNNEEDYWSNHFDNPKLAQRWRYIFNQIRLMLINRIDNIWYQEAPLYSNVLRVAGRVDLIAEYEGELSIIDFKSSKKLKKKEWIENYFIQLCMYKIMFRERTGIDIKTGYIIMSADNMECGVFPINLDAYIDMTKQAVIDYYRHISKYTTQGRV